MTVTVMKEENISPFDVNGDYQWHHSSSIEFSLGLWETNELGISTAYYIVSIFRVCAFCI